MLYKMKVVRIPIAEARKNLAGVMRQVSKGNRVKLTRYNKTLAGLVGCGDLTNLEECDRVLSTSRRRRTRKGGSGSAAGR
jgi:antitoxin (DNA-binding transcriptional repressor) of toxin-antitoxin stability system